MRAVRRDHRRVAALHPVYSRAMRSLLLIDVPYDCGHFGARLRVEAAAITALDPSLDGERAWMIVKQLALTIASALSESGSEWTESI